MGLTLAGRCYLMYLEQLSHYMVFPSELWGCSLAIWISCLPSLERSHWVKVTLAPYSLEHIPDRSEEKLLFIFYYYFFFLPGSRKSAAHKWQPSCTFCCFFVHAGPKYLHFRDIWQISALSFTKQVKPWSRSAWISNAELRYLWQML